ncbi:hypothetical protein PC116_g16696 [Phytophthora cactorum]|uniref:Uncharacterized protein n=1 Tax=Phytophthora cactorum TaxID=29920 RepID=A0A8T1E329_9STRA|nr:hypothetical protein PC117_g8398 [Phytophthora cactorum]KAG3026770.1 hypothetical protein PC119_g7642 [Phytophthora cactorum]KAG4235176.1 hypothetical protein PC116_g16696 [Phytophthora cactorum]
MGAHFSATDRSILVPASSSAPFPRFSAPLSEDIGAMWRPPLHAHTFGSLNAFPHIEAKGTAACGQALCGFVTAVIWLQCHLLFGVADDH